MSSSSPARRKLESAQSLTEGREGAVAATLPSGQVLIAGGYILNANDVPEIGSTAELFNAATETFTKLPGHALTEPRLRAVAAALASGQVLIAGGFPGLPSSAELFKPATDTFTKLSGSLTEVRHGAVAATLPSRQVLIAGGCVWQAIGTDAA